MAMLTVQMMMQVSGSIVGALPAASRFLRGCVYLDAYRLVDALSKKPLWSGYVPCVSYNQ